MIETALHFRNSYIFHKIKFYINTYLQNYKERKFKFWKLVLKEKKITFKIIRGTLWELILKTETNTKLDMEKYRLRFIY